MYRIKIILILQQHTAKRRRQCRYIGNAIKNRTLYSICFLTWMHQLSEHGNALHVVELSCNIMLQLSTRGLVLKYSPTQPDCRAEWPAGSKSKQLTSSYQRQPSSRRLLQNKLVWLPDEQRLERQCSRTDSGSPTSTLWQDNRPPTLTDLALHLTVCTL